MRTFVIALAMLTAMLTVACSTGPSVPDNIAGTWSAPSSDTTNGDPTTFILTDSSNVLAGTAIWTGQTGNVGGSYAKPNIEMTVTVYTGITGLRPDLFRGKAIDANTIVIGSTTYHRQQ